MSQATKSNAERVDLRPRPVFDMECPDCLEFTEHSLWGEAICPSCGAVYRVSEPV